MLSAAQQLRWKEKKVFPQTENSEFVREKERNHHRCGHSAWQFLPKVPQAILWLSLEIVTLVPFISLSLR